VKFRRRALAALVPVLFLASCGGGGAALPFDEDALVAEVTAAMESFLADTGAPGVTLALLLPDGDGGQREIRIAAGSSNVADDLPADSDHFYRFGSITKPMTSAIVLQLVDEGKVALDEPVSTYLGAGWAAGYDWKGEEWGDRITIRQILNHTDGFPEFAFDPGFYLAASTRIERPFEPEEIVEWAAGRGAQYEPGTDYLYNTVGHVVAGLVIEEVTGRTAAEEFEERLFGPVGADDAYLAPEEFPAEDGVAGYVQGALKTAIEFLPGYRPYLEEATVGDFLDVTVAPQATLRSAGWTGGGIEAQADDVARIFRSLFTSVVTGDELEEFLTPSPHSSYALGVSVGEKDGLKVYSHGGGVPGFRSDALYLPDLDVTIAVSTNLVAIDPDIGTLSDRVLAIIRAALA